MTLTYIFMVGRYDIFVVVHSVIISMKVWQKIGHNNRDNAIGDIDLHFQGQMISIFLLLAIVVNFVKIRPRIAKT